MKAKPIYFSHIHLSVFGFISLSFKLRECVCMGKRMGGLKVKLEKELCHVIFTNKVIKARKSFLVFASEISWRAPVRRETRLINFVTFELRNLHA